MKISKSILKEIIKEEVRQAVNEIKIKKLPSSDDTRQEPPPKQKKVDVDLEVHKEMMNKLINVMAPTTAVVNPKLRRKYGTKEKCGFWGPLLDLTATSEKAKKAGFFSQETSEDVDKLYLKAKRFVPSDEAGRYPKGFVPLDKGARSSNYRYSPGMVASNIGRGDLSLEKAEKDIGADMADCPPKSKCIRKCVKTSKIPVGKITYNMLKFTAEPKQKLDVQGKLIGLSYAPGTRYATRDFSEIFDQNILQKRRDLESFVNGVAKRSTASHGYEIFAGVHSPQGGSVKRNTGYKGYGTAIQFYASEGFSGGKPAGKVYPAYFNVKDGKVLLVPDLKNEIKW
jgi:hypothetical protein